MSGTCKSYDVRTVSIPCTQVESETCASITCGTDPATKSAIIAPLTCSRSIVQPALNDGLACVEPRTTSIPLYTSSAEQCLTGSSTATSTDLNIGAAYTTTFGTQVTTMALATDAVSCAPTTTVAGTLCSVVASSSIPVDCLQSSISACPLPTCDAAAAAASPTTTTLVCPFETIYESRNGGSTCTAPATNTVTLYTPVASPCVVDSGRQPSITTDTAQGMATTLRYGKYETTLSLAMGAINCDQSTVITGASCTQTTTTTVPIACMQTAPVVCDTPECALAGTATTAEVLCSSPIVQSALNGGQACAGPTPSTTTLYASSTPTGCEIDEINLMPVTTINKSIGSATTTLYGTPITTYTLSVPTAAVSNCGAEFTSRGVAGSCSTIRSRAIDVNCEQASVASCPVATCTTDGPVPTTTDLECPYPTLLTAIGSGSACNAPSRTREILYTTVTSTCSLDPALSAMTSTITTDGLAVTASYGTYVTSFSLTAAEERVTSCATMTTSKANSCTVHETNSAQIDCVQSPTALCPPITCPPSGTMPISSELACPYPTIQTAINGGSGCKPESRTQAQVYASQARSCSIDSGHAPSITTYTPAGVATTTSFGSWVTTLELVPTDAVSCPSTTLVTEGECTTEIVDTNVPVDCVARESASCPAPTCSGSGASATIATLSCPYQVIQTNLNGGTACPQPSTTNVQLYTSATRSCQLGSETAPVVNTNSAVGKATTTSFGQYVTTLELAVPTAVDCAQSTLVTAGECSSVEVNSATIACGYNPTPTCNAATCGSNPAIPSPTVTQVACEYPVTQPPLNGGAACPTAASTERTLYTSVTRSCAIDTALGTSVHTDAGGVATTTFSGKLQTTLALAQPTSLAINCESTTTFESEACTETSTATVPINCVLGSPVCSTATCPPTTTSLAALLSATVPCPAPTLTVPRNGGIACAPTSTTSFALYTTVGATSCSATTSSSYAVGTIMSTTYTGLAVQPLSLVASPTAIANCPTSTAAISGPCNYATSSTVCMANPLGAQSMYRLVAFSGIITSGSGSAPLDLRMVDSTGSKMAIGGALNVRGLRYGPASTCSTNTDLYLRSTATIQDTFEPHAKFSRFSGNSFSATTFATGTGICTRQNAEVLLASQSAMDTALPWSNYLIDMQNLATRIIMLSATLQLTSTGVLTRLAPMYPGNVDVVSVSAGNAISLAAWSTYRNSGNVLGSTQTLLMRTPSPGVVTVTPVQEGGTKVFNPAGLFTGTLATKVVLVVPEGGSVSIAADSTFQSGAPAFPALVLAPWFTSTVRFVTSTASAASYSVGQVFAGNSVLHTASQGNPNNQQTSLLTFLGQTFDGCIPL